MEFYLAMIVQFAGGFAPRGFMYTNGQLLSIAQNTALFSLLGTTFGGNGQTNFALPDLRSRVFVGPGQGPGLSAYVQGQVGGTENTTLTIGNMPAHNHAAVFTPSGSASVTVQALAGVPDAQLTGTPAAGSHLANTYDASSFTSPGIYAPASSTGTAVNLGGTSLSGVGGSVTVGITGSNLPFSNLQPYLGLQSIICVEGIFPSRN